MASPLIPLLSLALCTATSAATVTSRPLVLYVDPTSERLHVLPSLERRGCDCVVLHSAAAAAAILQNAGEDDDELRERVLERVVPPAGTETAWAEECLGLSDGTLLLSAVLCGSDGGLADAERLQDALLPARSNGCNPARRDKYLMNEQMRAAGLGAPLQCTPASWDETRSFLRGALGSSYPVVMKPRRGQASVLVGLAHDEEQAAHMDAILRDPAVRVSIDSSEHAAGDANVVVQEYLAGDEWVVDTVSRDGEHKVVALWRYDKGEANGAPFVYFGIEARGVEGHVERQLLAYCRKALDALGWRWGPCHIEVKMVPGRGAPNDGMDGDGADGNGADGDGAGGDAMPVLIEINAGRWNGEEFLPLAQLCNGLDALEATLDAYLDAAAWTHVPSTPPETLSVHGTNVKLVSHVEGRLLAAPSEAHAGTLRALKSLLSFHPEVNEVGAHVVRTVDLNTCAGYCHLAHTDESVVARDYRALRKLQPRLFEIEGS